MKKEEKGKCKKNTTHSHCNVASFSSFSVFVSTFAGGAAHRRYANELPSWGGKMTESEEWSEHETAVLLFVRPLARSFVRLSRLHAWFKSQAQLN